MSARDNSEPAFPQVVTEHDYDQSQEQFYANTYSHGGVTVRDWFAGKALQGLVARESSNTMGEVWLARKAYSLADAMLAERAK